MVNQLLIFWSKVNDKGDFEMSRYYIPILQGRLKNIWKIEHIDNFYILDKTVLNQLDKPYTMLNKEASNYDKIDKSNPSIIFSTNIRTQNIEMTLEGV